VWPDCHAVMRNERTSGPSSTIVGCRARQRRGGRESQCKPPSGERAAASRPTLSMIFRSVNASVKHPAFLSGLEKLVMASAAATKGRSLPLSLAYVGGFAITLFCFVSAWQTYAFLYIGRDGQYALVTSNAYRDWANPFDVTSINPLQGMTSMLVAINPYVNPGEWIFFTQASIGTKVLISYIVYFLEVEITTFALGLSIGFSAPVAFAAATWVAILLFPPYNYVFGLHAWIGTAPIYGHTMALCNLALICFFYVGDTRWVRRGVPMCWALNCSFATGIFALIVAILLAAPFYNGGMLIGLGIAGVAIFLASPTREQLLWRVGAGGYVVALGLVWNFPDFFLAARAYSVRFADTVLPLPAIDAPSLLSASNIAHARVLLCAWSVVCDRFPDLPFALTSSYWVHGSILAGGVAGWISLPKPTSRICLYVAGLWASLLIFWSLGALGLTPGSRFSPLYFYLMLYPLLALLSVSGVAVAADAILRNRRTPSLPIEVAAVGLVTAGVVILSAWMGVGFSTVSTKSVTPTPPPSTRIVDILRQEIRLRPADAFRGVVATVYGTRGGTMRRALGLTSDEPVRLGQFESYLRLAATSGSSHDLLDLWRWSIPTISEYGQGVSATLAFFVKHLLSGEGDEKELHFALPTAVNADVLRSMGVLFIVTDAAVASDKAFLRETISLKEGAAINLYELPHPNLGTYSPTTLITLTSTSDFLLQVQRAPNIFETHAFVEGSWDAQLVPARNARLIFENRGVHISARSDGRSALLLPVQFSNCYRWTGQPPGSVRLIRANLIHTLVLFERSIDLHLRWRYHFWRGGGCRWQDIRELKALGLL